MRRLRRRCGYVGVRIGEASHPGPQLDIIDEQAETDSGLFGDPVFLAVVENRMVTRNGGRRVRKIAKLFIRKGPQLTKSTPAICDGPGEDTCYANAYVHVKEEWAGLPSLGKTWRPRLQVNVSGNSRDWMGRRRVDLSFQLKKRRYYLHRLCGYAWGRGAALQDLTWARFYPRVVPRAGHEYEVDHVNGDCYSVDADRCSQHPRNPVASTAERWALDSRDW